MQSVNDWIQTSVKPFLKQSSEEEDYHSFMRDEIRPILKDPNVFYSCADGVIVYNRVLTTPKQKVDIKGVPYSIDDILGKPGLVTGPALICGVFMTFADIHLNRVPYTSILDYEPLDPIESYNLSMDATEKRLFGLLRPHKFKPSHEVDYLKNNARMLNRFYIPQLDYTYYIVQIADYEVDVIQPFSVEQHRVVHQGDRFSFVRWGSQCDLILPLRKDLTIKPIAPDMVHVKAGVDKVIQFI